MGKRERELTGEKVSCWRVSMVVVRECERMRNGSSVPDGEERFRGGENKAGDMNEVGRVRYPDQGCGLRCWLSRMMDE